jgi:hypothetical protein
VNEVVNFTNHTVSTQSNFFGTLYTEPLPDFIVIHSLIIWVVDLKVLKPVELVVN